MAILYIDNTNTSGDLTSATGWTFTNGSATVTCPADEGDANNELADGDYARANGGTQWYKVTARDAGGDSFTIDPVFQQANVGPVACNYQDVSVKDGTSTANAWCHPALATTDTVRTAGDIIKMRANQTHVLAGISLVADEDGTTVNPIQLKGCDSVDDPWSDASDVHVTFDFSDTAFNFSLSGDNYWWLENIDLIQTNTGSFGSLSISALGIKVIDCVIRDCSNFGVSVASNSHAEFVDCVFYSNGSHSLYLGFAYGQYVVLRNCSLYGGAATTNKGIYSDRRCRIEVYDTEFGAGTTHDDYDIDAKAAFVYLRRCKFNSAVEFRSIEFGGITVSEDHDQVIGAYKTLLYEGVTEKETTEVRAGGASSSIKVTPNSNANTNYLIEAMEWEEQAVPASEQTRGVCMKVTTNPGSYPANTELYLEAEYYNHAANDTVATTVSTAVLAANDTWVWFPVTFTPLQVQKVRYRVYLGTQENAESYYIDNQLYDADPT